MRDRLDWLAHEGEVAERGRCAAKLSRSSAWPQTTERTYLIRRSLMFVMRRISDPIQTWHTTSGTCHNPTHAPQQKIVIRKTRRRDQRAGAGPSQSSHV